jgi:cell division protein FtsN
MAKRIVNIRLRADQEERINAIVQRSAILDTSKFVRIAVDWLLRSDIGEVIKTIVADETAFPDYAMPKKPTGQKKQRRRKPKRPQR